jgi:hypothetical protein
MKTVYALQPIGKSIFLAGPTPRKDEIESWRPEALSILQELEFDGTVYVPESEDWKKHDNYQAQIEWEWQALDTSSVILFWVPRDLHLDKEGDLKMPAFTTNVEFGLAAKSGRVVLGYPIGTDKMPYLHSIARRFHIPVYNDLRDTIIAAKSIADRMF